MEEIARAVVTWAGAIAAVAASGAFSVFIIRLVYLWVKTG